MSPPRQAGSSDWSHRARLAEISVSRRHLAWFPGGHLARVADPASWRQRWFVEYHYWWQVQLLDCLLDAQARQPDRHRQGLIRSLPRALWVRNGFSWINSYFDDIAWLALALGRAAAWGLGHPRAQRLIEQRLYDAWPAQGAGIPWRVGCDFRNTPANSAMAIVMARAGHHRRAREVLDWMDAELRDETTDLFFDGLHDDGREEKLFTYNQGLIVGAELELVRRGDSPGRLYRLVEAVHHGLTDNGVLIGVGGGDGGLFGAITVRYLADVANRLPGTDSTARRVRSLASEVVLSSAEAAWHNRIIGPNGLYFGPDWGVPAELPRRRPWVVRRVGRFPEPTPSVPPEQDLSVQLAGWMLMEMAAVVAGNFQR